MVGRLQPGKPCYAQIGFAKLTVIGAGAVLIRTDAGGMWIAQAIERTQTKIPCEHSSFLSRYNEDFMAKPTHPKRPCVEINEHFSPATSVNYITHTHERKKRPPVWEAFRRIKQQIDQLT
jgi:hypothetical protein